mmetsp:Transcript_29736/g.61999  ORF Transcript_29736/g.61999 Transcript_29736/m.61999 type:complete len:111 (-) Transcript_29736:54-386(-)
MRDNITGRVYEKALPHDVSLSISRYTKQKMMTAAFIRIGWSEYDFSSFLLADDDFFDTVPMRVTMGIKGPMLFVLVDMVPVGCPGDVEGNSNLPKNCARAVAANTFVPIL